ncbi:hypothetical protein Trydic_g713 [Trypoxylus dichotomus]
MNIFYIVSCAILIATANAKPSTAGPNSDDDPFGYYDGPMDDSPPPDQNEDDVTTILRPKFLMQPETIVVKEGENATLRCPVENGKYFGAMWRKDEEVIAQGTISTKSDLYAILPNNTLLVKHVKPSSAGYYSCVIAISSSNNITLTHKLKLENAAEIVSLRVQNNVTQLHTGDTLILTCEVDGKPMPTIKWYFDSSDGAREISYGNHQSTGYKDTLTITDVSFKNNGTYRCFADNKISADHQSIVIEVFDKGRDTATSDSQISGGLRLLPSLLLVAVTAVIMNP